jgi:hypothetical protein
LGTEDDTNGESVRALSASNENAGRLGLISLGGRSSSVRRAWCEVLLRIVGASSAGLCPREKKLALEAVIGVLGVFMLFRMPGGVAGGSPDSDLTLSDLILAEVGVLRGNKFNGGSLRVCNAFLLALCCCCCFGCGSGCICGCCSGSGSDGKAGTGGAEELCEASLGARGVSSVFMASATVETTGLAEIAPSNGGKPDDLAEKNG